MNSLSASCENHVPAIYDCNLLFVSAHAIPLWCRIRVWNVRRTELSNIGKCKNKSFELMEIAINDDNDDETYFNKSEQPITAVLWLWSPIVTYTLAVVAWMPVWLPIDYSDYGYQYLAQCTPIYAHILMLQLFSAKHIYYNNLILGRNWKDYMGSWRIWPDFKSIFGCRQT